MDLLISILAILTGIILIHIGSKEVVFSALSLSERINLHKAAVGAIFVALATSLPEFVTSLVAALSVSSYMALGNIIGSNIYNVPLVLGICGLIREFRIKDNPVKDQCLFMIGMSGMITLISLVFGAVTWWIALSFLAAYPIIIFYHIRRGNGSGQTVNGSIRLDAKIIAAIILGGAILACGSYLLVHGALSVVNALGITHFYAGLTILSFGCIIPELAVSVAAAIRGEEEISIGNVIGDNIITMTLVLGSVGLIRPFVVSFFDIISTVPFMILVTLILYAMALRRCKVTKVWSVLMLALAGIFLLEISYNVI
ncbi:MAG: hypothetical protein RMJ07_01725 [Nitrososphaerota archaeon]|nr:hypothetical protein [Candidatus Bathyarchaeota archaeon]MDW8048387.1 hypothetical protein [Nitrososphaerota archaeon]